MQSALKVQKYKKWYIVGFAALLTLFATFVFMVEPSLAATGTIEAKINEGSKMILNLFKSVLGAIMVIMIAWAGYVLLFSRSSEGLAQLKVQAGVFVLCAALVLAAEPIYNTIAGFLGSE